MKPIKLTTSSIAKAKEDILTQLDNLKLRDSKISFTYDFTKLLQDQMKKDIPNPIVYMTASTYLKMLEYVLKCDTEIAWHGTVKRGTGKKKHIFYIKDVYLYPQKVAGVTVKTLDDKYQVWSDKQSDEDFNNRRFQGHSHVNMATVYSGTDNDNQNAFLQDLEDNDYYIFLVTNKRQEHNFRIYDLAQNILFENEDIDFRVYLNEDTILDSVDNEIKSNCEKETYSTTTKYSGYKYGNYLDNYNNYEKYGKYYDNYPQDDPTTTKRYVALQNRSGRDFEKEYPEFEGETILIQDKKNKDIKVFIPFESFGTKDITRLRKDGWHIKEMDVPAEYDEI